jgi:hypothetical protein
MSVFSSSHEAAACCVDPRPFGDREAYSARRPGNPSDVAVREIISEMSRRGGKGSLFVLRG